MDNPFLNTSPSLRADAEYFYANEPVMEARLAQMRIIADRVDPRTFRSLVRPLREKVTLAELYRRYENLMRDDFATTERIIPVAVHVYVRAWEVKQKYGN